MTGQEEVELVARNPTAGRDFYILETVEAGLVLQGAEVKSIRAHRVHLRDSFARMDGPGITLYNLEISPYAQAGSFAPEPKRPRRLLLHKAQIARLTAQVSQLGMTLIPTKLYFKRGYAKIELGVAKGKKTFDKRETIRRREADREMARALKSRGHASR
ncbi:MAG: SsrA-binding protein [Omnitrophica WOR_2 bacterium RIFCSPHIGHO2_02_FULL_68_15]|nr:MAG: SsrA-binding protein [Omnitrophica WOR_2 bacterium RIFCSPHIGHO2_02_FULL_68_15]